MHGNSLLFKAFPTDRGMTTTFECLSMQQGSYYGIISNVHEEIRHIVL